MSETTGGSFPAGSYLRGAIPSEEQLAVQAQREAERLERRRKWEARQAPDADPHDVLLGMDGSTFRPRWTCQTEGCSESEGEFMTGDAAHESARQHAGPNGRVST